LYPNETGMANKNMFDLNVQQSPGIQEFALKISYRNCLKKGDVLMTLLFNIRLQYTISRVRLI